MGRVILNTVLGIINLGFFIKFDNDMSYVNLVISILCLFGAFRQLGMINDNNK